METNQHSILLSLQPGRHDGDGQRVAADAARHLGLATGQVRSAALYAVRYPGMSAAQVADFAAACLQDPVLHTAAIDEVAAPAGFKSYILVAKGPGVTDDEGTSAQNALGDFLNEPIDTRTQHIFSKRLYFVEHDLPATDLRRLAEELLGNKLINRFEVGAVANGIRDFTPRPGGGADARTETIALGGLADEQLLQLSKDNVYALNLPEMQAIRDYFGQGSVREQRLGLGLPADPTDCEMEILAQTWSEHCKHKEFSAVIKYKNHETGAVE
ncbi:MAG: phosphoribosylformylglycinamidine synthase, partial [Cytophagaceae bacterium]